MRIAYLHQYFKTPDMSGGTRSYEMARRLVDAGHEVHILTTFSPTESTRRWRPSLPKWSEEKIDGISVHWLPVAYDNRMSFKRRILAFGAFAALASARARRLKADVVFASSTPLTIAVPGIVATAGTDARMVFEVRDLWPDVPIALGALKSRGSRWLARGLERQAYRRSSAIVALSEDMKDGVVSVDKRPERVTVIPNSCDNELFDVPHSLGAHFRASRDWLRDRPLVLYAGTLGKVNGISYLARLAAESLLLDPNVRFLVVGDGAERDTVRDLARKLGVLERNFFMEPPVPKREMPSLLSAATVCTSFVIPIRALEANSANKFFDALAAARPIAINHGGWMADVIEKHGLGVVLDPRDERLAAGELLGFLNDHEALQSAGASARRLAHDRYSRDRLAVALERVLADGEKPHVANGALRN